MAADEAASPCSKERSEAAGTHEAHGSGRGERKRALLSPKMRVGVAQQFSAHARAHTHTPHL